MSNKTEQIVEEFNSLLRGELSAVETYDKALEKFAGDSESQHLSAIRADHLSSVEEIKGHIQKLNGEPSEDSGAWGTFANSVVGAAKLVGEDSAIAALKQGEEHGKRDYESTLEKDFICSECESLIKNSLLPRQLKHISTLERLSN